MFVMNDLAATAIALKKAHARYHKKDTIETKKYHSVTCTKCLWSNKPFAGRTHCSNNGAHWFKGIVIRMITWV